VVLRNSLFSFLILLLQRELRKSDRYVQFYEFLTVENLSSYVSFKLSGFSEMKNKSCVAPKLP
jgi:hypothetical protein